MAEEKGRQASSHWRRKPQLVKKHAMPHIISCRGCFLKLKLCNTPLVFKTGTATSIIEHLRTWHFTIKRLPCFRHVQEQVKSVFPCILYITGSSEDTGCAVQGQRAWVGSRQVGVDRGRKRNLRDDRLALFSTLSMSAMPASDGLTHASLHSPNYLDFSIRSNSEEQENMAM